MYEDMYFTHIHIFFLIYFNIYYLWSANWTKWDHDAYARIILWDLWMMIAIDCIKGILKHRDTTFSWTLTAGKIEKQIMDNFEIAAWKWQLFLQFLLHVNIFLSNKFFLKML